MEKRLVLGLDYGSDSVRALLVDMASGEEIATSVCFYPRWKEGKYCDPARNQFRQHPLDYLEGLKQVIVDTLQQAPDDAARQVGAIGIDTTGSTPVAVNRKGEALALLPEFAENPNAMFILWKDHTAIAEAEAINQHAHGWGGEDYTRYSGGTYSSEWFWAKILHTLRVDEKVREAAFSWVEHCDWLPAILTGNKDPLQCKRGRCAAGHKAMWHADWGGLPSEEFLGGIDPLLKGLRDRLYTETVTADQSAGGLTAEWAGQLGLPEGIPVTVGAFDAHMGAIGANVRPGSLVKVMGTSTCDMAVAKPDAIGDKCIRGICGQVDGSIVPGLIGLEAGQSAFGDLYAWYRDLLAWPARQMSDAPEQTDRMVDNLLAELAKAAEGIVPTPESPVALDWINGRRTPDANQSLKMAVDGLTMGCDAPALYRAIVEATAFGAKAIVECFQKQGIPIDNIIATGGISHKAPLVMQICADVLDCTIEVVRSEQCCALGAAMCAAVASGAYASVAEAQAAMHPDIMKTWQPTPGHKAAYQALYGKYRALGAFVERGLVD